MNAETQTKAQLIAELAALHQHVVQLEATAQATAQDAEASRLREQRYRSLFENVPLGLYITSPEGQILDANAALVEMLGFPDLDALLALKALDLYADPQDRARWLASIEQEDVKLGIELRLRRRDGRVIWVRDNARAVRDTAGRVLYYEGSLEDITERKQMIEEIQQRNQGLAAINAVSSAAVSTLELDTMLHQILERTCQALDAEEGSILLREPDTGELFFAVALQEKVDRLRHVRLRAGQGIAGWVLEHGEPVCVNDVSQDPRWHQAVDHALEFETRSLLCAPMTHRGSITGVIEIVNKRDGAFDLDDLSLLVAVCFIAASTLENARLYVTSQARVEELALLNEISLVLTSTLDYNTVVHAALSQIVRLYHADAVFLLQPDFESNELAYVYTLVDATPVENPFRLPRGTGIPGWALQHQQAVLVEDAQADPRFSRQADRYLGAATHGLMAAPLLRPERAIGVIEVASRQVAVYHKEDLRTLESIASVLAVALENARLYAEQERLLEAMEQTQQQLVHSAKMSALGRLAASIAHEINNPLQAIQSCLTLAEEELAGRRRQEKLTRYLTIVDSEFERIAAFVQRMRQFYRPVQAERTATDIHDVLGSVLELLQKQLQQSHVVVRYHLARKLPPVHANPDHLRQVFLNLVLNAIDAMAEGGTLFVSTGLDYLQPTPDLFDSSEERHEAPAVRIDFRDTGNGMPPAVQARLFEPFFTTKEHGSGLGLSVSYGIIQSHKGEIRVESAPGAGTTFSILLPAMKVPLDQPDGEQGASEDRQA